MNALPMWYDPWYWGVATTLLVVCGVVCLGITWVMRPPPGESMGRRLKKELRIVWWYGVALLSLGFGIGVGALTLAVNDPDAVPPRVFAVLAAIVGVVLVIPCLVNAHRTGPDK